MTHQERRIQRLQRLRDLLADEAYNIVLKGDEIKKSKSLITIKDHLMEVEKLQNRYDRLHKKYLHFHRLYEASRKITLDNIFIFN